jgi:hypothetical protein
MYIAVRKYHLLPGSSREFLQRVQEGFVPLVSQISGFLAYDAHHVGDNQVLTTSTFDTRAGAEESILLALRWVQEHCIELTQGLPRLEVARAPTASKAISIPHVQHSHGEKMLVLNLTYEVLHPSALGDRAYADPRIGGMVTAIRQLLTQMRADPLRREKVYYRFDHEILPEEATSSLYQADHVILIKRRGRLAGYVEINQETNAWLRRERYEGDILVDPAAYQRDADGKIVEKGIGEQGLLEMRRQARLLRVKDIELDVYQGNQPMHRFLDHLIAKHRLPFTKREMTYGRAFDNTYLLACEPASGSEGVKVATLPRIPRIAQQGRIR